MCVDFSRPDIGVAQKLLNHSKISAALEHVGSKRVAECVGVNIVETGRVGGAFYDLPDCDAFERLAAVGEENAAFIHSGGVDALDQFRAAVFEIGIKSKLGFFADGHQAGLTAFAKDANGMLRFHVIAEADGRSFGSAQAAGIDEFEQCAVAEVEIERVVVVAAIGGGCFDQLLHLDGADDIRQVFPARGAVEVDTGI